MSIANLAALKWITLSKPNNPLEIHRAISHIIGKRQVKGETSKTHLNTSFNLAVSPSYPDYRFRSQAGILIDFEQCAT